MRADLPYLLAELLGLGGPIAAGGWLAWLLTFGWAP